MRRITLQRLGGLLLAAVLASCAPYRAQHASHRPAAGAAPAASPVTPPAPGGAAGRRLSLVRGEIAEIKESLAREGHYNCCVRPSCNECLLQRGECHCRLDVEKKGPCCGECTEAWIEGKGAVEGVSAWELLQRKKDLLQQKTGGQPPG
jgi:hypothetical protein